jgi:hypothetical protein
MRGKAGAQGVIILLTNSLFQKIYYRHHPFYGTEVEVVRALRRFDEQSFVVKLPEGLQIAVPAWMLDAVFCSQLQQRDHPSIALRALLELAQLIDAQRLPSSLINSESGPSPRRGGIDAPRKEERLSSTETGLCEPGAVGKTSRTPSASMPRTDR